MIDLSGMRGVRVDAAARSVRVAGGALLGDVDRETQLFGLAVPSGYVSETGVAGLTLGGGYGAMCRKHGLTCDNLISVDIVTADGQLRVASEHENTDLFWAIRGGGGNFGVVTSFEFRCHPIGPLVYVCRVAYALEEAVPVLRQWRDLMVTASEEMSAGAVIATIPDNPNFPKHVRGRAAVVIAITYNGDVEARERAIRPLRQLGTPIMDVSRVMPYVSVQRMGDTNNPPHTLQYYWKTTYLDQLDDAAIAALVRAGNVRPTDRTTVQVMHLGGAIARVDPTNLFRMNQNIKPKS
jgi:hypothetical protein